MKSLASVILLLFIATFSFGQDFPNISYGLTAEENELWLKRVIPSEKGTQLTLIQNRFFKRKDFTKSANTAIPVVIANGIVVNEIVNTELKNLLATQLTTDKVQITIVEKEPEGLYVNKAWTGIIVLSISDKKINKLLKRYKP
ncbi:hypothetical protein [Pedobacter sandarakinus]|uniref:hypothetical protein n=1 Tax=Pedobacter sandarakinus TaxID=353156 RepID=UPI002245C43B|nr:hypothetical protein [Pedobacter sandarakinus]MCX2574645.1 hypothetical protein [Pedobacter sandarakinus]